MWYDPILINKFVSTISLQMNSERQCVIFLGDIRVIALCKLGLKSVINSLEKVSAHIEDDE